MSTATTRAALQDAAVRLTSREGMRVLTARSVAAEAGVNQALVFYHFGSLDDLLREAFATATRAMIADYVDELAGASTFADLHAVGLRLAERSRSDGSAALLAQVVAAAHHDPAQAAALHDGLQAWHEALTDAVRRALATSGVAGEVDVEATTAALAAATVGMITLDAVPHAVLGDTLASVGVLATVADRVLRFVPAAVARRVLGSRRGAAR